MSGPAALSVKRGQQSQASYALTPVDGFSATADVTVQQIDSFPGAVSATAPRVPEHRPCSRSRQRHRRGGRHWLKIRMSSGTPRQRDNRTVQIERR